MNDDREDRPGDKRPGFVDRDDDTAPRATVDDDRAARTPDPEGAPDDDYLDELLEPPQRAGDAAATAPLPPASGPDPRPYPEDELTADDLADEGLTVFDDPANFEPERAGGVSDPFASDTDPLRDSGPSDPLPTPEPDPYLPDPEPDPYAPDPVPPTADTLPPDRELDLDRRADAPEGPTVPMQEADDLDVYDDLGDLDDLDEFEDEVGAEPFAGDRGTGSSDAGPAEPDSDSGAPEPGFAAAGSDPQALGAPEAAAARPDPWDVDDGGAAAGWGEDDVGDGTSAGTDEPGRRDDELEPFDDDLADGLDDDLVELSDAGLQPLPDAPGDRPGGRDDDLDDIESAVARSGSEADEAQGQDDYEDIWEDEPEEEHEADSGFQSAAGESGTALPGQLPGPSSAAADTPAVARPRDGSDGEEYAGRRFPWALGAVAAVALVLLAFGGYGVLSERRALRAEIQELQAKLAVAAQPEEVEELRQRARAADQYIENVEAQLTDVALERDELAARLAELEQTVDDAEADAAARAQEAQQAQETAARVAAERNAAAAPPQPATDAGPWFVNFGSYSQRAVAERWASRLEVDQGRVFIQSAEVNGRDIYRLRVAGLPDRSSAERVARALQARFDLPPLWVGR